MENLVGLFAAFGLLIILVSVGIFIACGLLLNKLNRLIYGKGTALAWIPICNIYLLGKLTVNKLVGWILVVCMLLTGTYTTTINGVETTHTLMPESISSIFSTVYGIAVLALFIYAIVKYNQLKKN